MSNRRESVVLIGTIATLISAACSASPSAAPAAAATPQMLAEGQQVYANAGRCAGCHGPVGQGTSFAPDLTDDDWIWIQTNQAIRPQLVTIIRNGISEPRRYGTPMPPMGGAQLSPQQLESVAAYVESL